MNSLHNPLWIPLAVLLPLGVLAGIKRIYPHRPLVLLILVPGLLSLSVLIDERLLWPLLGLDGLLGCVAVADLLTLPTKRGFSAERVAPRIVSLGKSQPVELTLGNRTGREQFVHVRDSRPADLDFDPEELILRLPPRSRSAVHYQLRARRRGAFQLDQVYLRVRSRGGFWYRYLRYDVSNVLHVYPDIGQLGEYALLARTNRLSLLGVRRTRKIGQDNEFERLRDYSLDDSYKHIDWRSTARRGKLTVKDFQANQSQRLLFLVDCGRMMTNTAGRLTLLDHALNALLMLSFVALRQGDSVGLLCFSDNVHRYVPPRSGMNQMNRLLHATFDRFPRLVESRYDQAFLYLAAHARKRSLVVLLTNVIDDVNAGQVQRYLANQVGRHLPLGVLLRDRQMFALADGPTDDDEALYRAAAAADVLIWRRQVLADLQASGVLTVDVFPEQLTARLVNRYLDIKARHLL